MCFLVRSVIVPSGYSSVFDANGGDTINGGDNNLNVFLGAGTAFNTGGGSDLIHAVADTITAGFRQHHGRGGG